MERVDGQSVVLTPLTLSANFFVSVGTWDFLTCGIPLLGLATRSLTVTNRFFNSLREVFCTWLFGVQIGEKGWDKTHRSRTGLKMQNRSTGTPDSHVTCEKAYYYIMGWAMTNAVSFVGENTLIKGLISPLSNLVQFRFRINPWK